MPVLPASWTLLLLAGCSLDHTGHWSDQLEPEGPCWNVNLVDGLDESSTSEMHDLFACMNQSGNLDPLSELDESIDAETRFNEPVGHALARLVNTLPASGFDVFGVVGKILQLLNDFIDDAELVQATIVEFIYGHPIDSVDTNLHSTTDGVADPFIRLMAVTASALLDNGEVARAELEGLSESQLLKDTVCSISAAVNSSNEDLSALPDQLLLNVSEAWILAADSSNDLQASTSGNSLRDLIHWLDLGSETSLIEPIRNDVNTLLSDPRVKAGTRSALEQANSDGHLELIAPQLLYLASVDAEGRDLSDPSAESTSALQTSLRMLHNANREMICTIPIVGIEIELGNLSVEIVREVATTDPDTSVERLDFLGDVLGLGLTQLVAENLAESGACPAFDSQLLADLRVVERMNDPAVGNLVEVVHGLLDAVYIPGEMDRLPQAVNIGAFLYESEAMGPVEEVLRDISSSNLTDDIVTLVPMLLDPSSLSTVSCADGSAPLSFDLVWDTLDEHIDSDADTTLVHSVWPAIEMDPNTWALLDRLSILASNEQAHIRTLPHLAVDLLMLEGTNETFESAGALIEQEAIYYASLSVAENATLVEALTSTDSNGSGPLPFLADIILSDTVTVMLQTVNSVLDSLGVNSSETD